MKIYNEYSNYRIGVCKVVGDQMAIKEQPDMIETWNNFYIEDKSWIYLHNYIWGS